MESNLNKFFYPASLCIIGASGKKGNLGYELTSCVKSYGYTGRLFLVNPKTEEILGIQCHPSVPDIKEDIDQALKIKVKADSMISDLIHTYHYEGQKLALEIIKLEKQSI